MPMPQAPNTRRKKKKRRKKSAARSVFFVARPLKDAGPFGFLSDGKVPLCHWGLFISNEDPSNVISWWEKYRRTKELSDPPSRGTLFELARLGSKCTVSKRQDFGLELWDAEWGHIWVKYAGETKRTDEELGYFGD